MVVVPSTFVKGAFDARQWLSEGRMPPGVGPVAALAFGPRSSESCERINESMSFHHLSPWEWESIWLSCNQKSAHNQASNVISVPFSLSLSLSLVKIQLWYLVCTVVYNMSTYKTLHVYIFCRALELHNLNPSAVYFYMVTKLSSVYFYMVSEQCSWNNAPITANRHTTESTA